MNSPIEKAQVFDAIIISDAVDVIHGFVWQELAAEDLFHDRAVFQHSLPIEGDAPIVVSRSSHNTLGVAVTSKRAEPLPLSARRRKESVAASVAYDRARRKVGRSPPADGTQPWFLDRWNASLCKA